MPSIKFTWAISYFLSFLESKVITVNLEIIPSSTTEVSSNCLSIISLSGSEDSPSATQPVRKSWPESFKVPWDVMPAEIRTAISSCKRPSPGARRQMVRIISDEMRKYELNPTRAQCLVVCRNIVHQYPESFADQRDNGQLLDSGYTSLLIQVKNRIENLNRASSFHQHRSASHGQKRGPTDIYGCTRFQPSLPSEETEDTMETKRQQLEGIYSRDGTAGAERPEVKKLVDSTFYLQRSHINVVPTPTIASLKTKWPYLFSQKGLYSHFELLTDIPVLRSLELAMEECGKAIVEMFKTKPTNARMKEVLRQRDDDVELSYQVIHLLLSHFSEDVSGLIVLADVSSPTHKHTPLSASLSHTHTLLSDHLSLPHFVSISIYSSIFTYLFHYLSLSLYLPCIYLSVLSLSPYQSIPISSSISTSISPSFPLSPSLSVSPSISVSI